MALTIANPGSSITGQRTEQVNQVTCDASYPASGYALTPAQLGLPGGVAFALAVVQNPGADVAGAAWYDVANQKLHLYAPTTGAELAAAVNCSAIIVELFALGGF